MRAQEIDFLVGTQMVAKGLDFPGVTLVGVVVADTALHFPDFRASERTFQLLSQVAGRAGRGKKHGRVIIQTFSPKHPAVVFARDHDYLALYEEILEEREAVGYPPFNRLVNVLFTGADRSETIRKSAEAGKAVQEAFQEALILGPVDCSIERLHNQFRRHLIIKAGHGVSLKPIQTALAKLDFGRVQVTIDVDPYTMI
jgi:primosomal protein N' (replication factor Y)